MALRNLLGNNYTLGEDFTDGFTKSVMEDVAEVASTPATAKYFHHDFTPPSPTLENPVSNYFSSPKKIIPGSDVRKLAKLNYLNSKEISTQLDNI